MSNFVVEVSLPEKDARSRIEEAVRAMGSHFATHADWRQNRGRYTGSIVVDAEDGQAALAIVPPGLRAAASAVLLPALAA